MAVVEERAIRESLLQVRIHRGRCPGLHHQKKDRPFGRSHKFLFGDEFCAQIGGHDGVDTGGDVYGGDALQLLGRDDLQ